MSGLTQAQILRKYPKPNIPCDLEFITPAKAEIYITGNVHNRDLMQPYVDKFRRVLLRGKWDTTHQGIAFDINGRLIDGQHRLYAIWLTGDEDPNFEGVWCFVTRGLPEGTIFSVDGGRGRTITDRIKLKNPDLSASGFSRHHTAITRQMAGGLAGRKVLKTDDEVEEFATRHYEAIQFAHKCVPVSIKGSSAGLKAAIARAFYHVAPEILTRFGHVFASGFYDMGEEAAIALKNALQSSNYAKNSDAMGQLVYARTERALDAFSKHRPLRKTPAPVQEEMFPLPEEVSAAKAAAAAVKEAKATERAKTRVARLKETRAAKTENVNRPLITNRGNMGNTGNGGKAGNGATPARTVRVIKGGGRATARV